MDRRRFHILFAGIFLILAILACNAAGASPDEEEPPAEPTAAEDTTDPGTVPTVDPTTGDDGSGGDTTDGGTTDGGTTGGGTTGGSTSGGSTSGGGTTGGSTSGGSTSGGSTSGGSTSGGSTSGGSTSGGDGHSDPTPTYTYTPGGPTPTYTPTPDGPTPTYTPTTEGPTLTPTYTPTTEGPTPTYTPTPTEAANYTIAPNDNDYSLEVNFKQSGQTIQGDVSYPEGDNRDSIFIKVVGFDSVQTSTDLTFTLACTGDVDQVQVSGLSCNNTTTRFFTNDSDQATFVIEFTGGEGYYVQWTLIIATP